MVEQVNGTNGVKPTTVEWPKSYSPREKEQEPLWTWELSNADKAANKKPGSQKK